ncbi:MAG TPA: hypothetical protein VL333_13275 [Candidatus Saccharimonadales bacterium]|jgi:hypothetical protein|nr:hypothetical protein [Candidatus Saccharimonadales bacterium]
MTAEEMAILALARTSEITEHYPATRSTMYRRMGLRQRELMTLAAKANPDYYGVCALSNLDSNTATDLNDIIEPVPTPELISLVKIEDPGTSQWAAGTEINIVPAAQKDCELPPRATLRDLVLQGVDTDLVGVTSVEILYSRIAAAFGPFDGDSVLELQAPWDELLVIDLTKHLLGKATRLPQDIQQAAIAALDKEEAPILTAYIDHVTNYAPLTTRFTRRVART